MGGTLRERMTRLDARSVGAGAWVATVCLGIGALAACSDATEPEPVDLDPFADPSTAALQVDSVVRLFECGYSTLAWVGLGYEGVDQALAGILGNTHRYIEAPAEGECDTSETSRTWFDPIMGARSMISNRDGTGVYDRLRDDWSLGSDGERLGAIASVYMAAALGVFGEFFCEMSLDGGDLLTPDDVLAMAEDWITNRALVHIESHGDFPLDRGVTGSVETMAIALRARIRWARGDLAGAATDAERVPRGFVARISRDEGLKRRNRVYVGSSFPGFISILGLVDWWNPKTRAPNPATGQLWPDPVPFTGYRFLGILPDGRAVDDGGYPIRWAEERRDYLTGNPVPLNNGAISDTRVTHHAVYVSGPDVPEAPEKYASEGDDIPFVGWREMWLIRAEREGGQTAIDLVDDLREAAGLPDVTYIDGGTATPEQVRFMVLEERRRSLYGEGGRFWSTKIRNPDVLWFPRAEGTTPWQGYPLGGGVRLALPEDEYLTNPSLFARGGLDARGTGCDPAVAPIFP